MRSNILTFGGKSLSDFGVIADFAKTYKTPGYSVESIEIPGKNGDLLFSDDRYSNVTVIFNCFIAGDDIREQYSQLIDYLTSFDGGYARLENAADPNVYRMGCFKSATDPERGKYWRTINFELSFDCMPQKFLKSGETAIEVSSSITLNNPTYKRARPLIYVTAMTDDGTIAINSQTISAEQFSDPFYIDCDLMYAYRIVDGEVVSTDTTVTMPDKYVELVPGENTVQLTNCTIEITPRWWRL